LKAKAEAKVVSGKLMQNGGPLAIGNSQEHHLPQSDI
jgi:hypothetical protein